MLFKFLPVWLRSQREILQCGDWYSRLLLQAGAYAFLKTDS